MLLDTDIYLVASVGFGWEDIQKMDAVKQQMLMVQSKQGIMTLTESVAVFLLVL